MARYRDVAADLRGRIVAGEFAVGSALPTIAELQQHYGVAALNTIRQAQRLLADEGLLEPRQGLGVYVISTAPRPPASTVLAELKAARTALDRAITLLEHGGEDGDDRAS